MACRMNLAVGSDSSRGAVHPGVERRPGRQRAGHRGAAVAVAVASWLACRGGYGWSTSTRR